MMQRLIALLVSVVLAEPPSVTEDGETAESSESGDSIAAQEEAEALGDAAAALHGAGRYDEASRLLREAYDLDPDPKYVYGQARAEQGGGHCDYAIALFEQFIELTGDPSGWAARGVRECEEVLMAKRPDPPPRPVVETPPAEAVGEPTPEVVSDQPPRRADRAAWVRDPWGGALVGIGVASLAVGGGLWGLAVSHRNAGRDTMSEAEFVDRDRAAYRSSVAGTTLLSVGATLVLGAVIRYAVVARRERRASRSRTALRAR
jgi:tetratricopeptide (TPR) repeat protein